MSLLQERLHDPPHHGALANATGVGSVGNPACGDVLTMYIRSDDERIVEATFESIGSIFQLATASVLCDCIAGESIHAASERTSTCITKRLPDLPRNKQYLAKLALDALQRALADQARRRSGAPAPERVPMTDADAQAYVVDMLSNGRAWGTVELDAMAAADHRGWPCPLAKFLMGLANDGVIAGEMAGSSWRWWSPEALGNGRDARDE